MHVFSDTHTHTHTQQEREMSQKVADRLFLVAIQKDDFYEWLHQVVESEAEKAERLKAEREACERLAKALGYS